MRPVSDRFGEAIFKSHKVAIEVNVLTPYESIPIDVIDGSVTLDATAASRGSLDLTVPHDLAPVSPGDPLAPYSNEIQVFRGIEYVDGTRELVPLGIYRIEEMQDTGDACHIIAVDRSMRVIEAKFEEAKLVSAYDTNIVDAIKAMLGEVYPWDFSLFGETSYEVPDNLAVEEGDDRWDACQVCAEAIGCALYFNADGLPFLQPVPVATQTPIASVTEGEGGDLLDASRTWSRQDAHNLWIVRGNTEASTESGGATPRGTAYDLDPNSPTRYNGPFGHVPDWYDNEYVVSNAQANYVAAIRRTLLAGISQTAPFSSLVNPALEPLDVVKLTRARTHLDENVIVDSLTIPLSVEGSMSASTRSALVPQ